MKKLAGIALFLLLLYAALLLSTEQESWGENNYNLARRIGLYGLVTLGAGVLIISGGIDLSIGSVVALGATFMVVLLRQGVGPLPAMLATLGVGCLIGLLHGLLVTKLRVQAFVVTLCGLFIYRGLARWLGKDEALSLGNTFPTFWRYWLYRSRVVFGLPMSLVILLAVAALVTVFLHRSVYGRYLSAIGSNEKAVRYSGIPTDRYKVFAYVLCSALAAFYAVLSLMENNQVQPNTDGTLLELYAIAGAVLGGCSLRGGEGNVLGMLIGTAILVLLANLVTMWEIPSALEYTVIGGALLLGAILDEGLRRGEGRRTRGAREGEMEKQKEEQKSHKPGGPEIQERRP
jgi:ribose transport system permease protein